MSDTYGTSGALVERVQLIVEAPDAGLNSAHSGLNIALSKLSAIDHMLKRVAQTYKDVAAEMRGGDGLIPTRDVPLKGGAAGKTGRGRATSSGTVSLDIPAAQIKASIAAGQVIALEIPAAQIQATVTGQVQAATTSGTGSGGGGSSRGGGGSAATAGTAPKPVPGGRPLSTKTVDGNLREEVFALDEMNTLTQTLQHSEKGTTTEVIKNNHALREQKSALAMVAKEHGTLNELLAQQLQGAEPVKRLQLMAWGYEQLAGSVGQAIQAHKNLDELTKSRLGKQESDMRLKAVGFINQADTLAAKQAQKAERDRVAAALQAGRRKVGEQYMVNLQAAGQDEWRVAAARQQRAKGLAQLHTAIAGTTTGPLADDLAARGAAHQARAYLAGNRMDLIQKSATEQEIGDHVRKAELQMRADYAHGLAGAGDDRTLRRRAVVDYRSRQAEFYHAMAGATSGGMSEGFSKQALGSWEKASVVMAALNREAHKTAQATSYVGRNMLENVKKVTAWTTSVGLLYGSLRLARSGFQSLVEVGHQSARLSQVLKGGTDEAARLTDEIMSLASANGRSNKEAMESAIAWSRLGLRRTQVAEAVRVSLLASNVAEISAAEATEHLSSLMMVYNLRASDLGGVLGMLNNVTNTYNVTNAELLTGLTRTSAIAKQAGIPLAELVGLLGAGVGATGQTGANIGNAIKSFIGALSSEDKLKTLREVFHFEGTRGAQGELKNMSELLAELWVSYQRMSSAEKQSALFSVAGKNQASRMAAILDHYVRAQTLAISAQLNLNSAEQENARIKATLKSQMASLVAEWERFINLQGNRGPVRMLTEMTTALKNLIRVANLPGLNVVSSLILGLGGAIAAKTALTGYKLAKAGEGIGGDAAKNSILANTVKALGREKDVMGNILAAMAMRGSGLSHWISGKTGGRFGSGREVELPDGSRVSRYRRSEDGRFERAKTYKEHIFGVGGAPDKIREVVTGWEKVSQKAMAARVAMAAVSDVVLPLLLVAGAVMAVNWALDKFGLNTDAAQDRIAKLGEAAQRSESAAEAGDMRERLFGNAQKAFGARESTQSNRLSIAQQLTEAYAPYEAGDDEAERKRKDKLREDRRKEAEEIAKIEDAGTRNARSKTFFDQLRGESLEFRNRQRKASRDRLAEQIAEIDSTLESPFLSQGQRRDWQEKRQGLTDKRIGSLLEESEDNNDALERFKANSIEYQSAMEGNKKTLEEIRELWNQLPGDSYLDKLYKQRQAQQEVLNVTRQQLEAVNQEIRGMGEVAAHHDEIKAKVEAEDAAIREGRVTLDKRMNNASLEDVMEITGAWPGFGGNHGGTTFDAKDQERRKQARQAQAQQDREALDARQKANDEARAGLSQVDADTDYRVKRLEADALRKQLDEQQVALNVINHPNRATAAQAMDMHSVALRWGNLEAGSWELGETKAEQFVSRQAALSNSIAEREDQLRRGAFSGVDLDNAKLINLQHRVALTEDLVRGEEMLAELGKEEVNTLKIKTREYERALLLTGPGELLRKLAVQSVSANGLSAGRFLAMDPAARRDWMDLPENTEEMRRIRRDQGYLRNAGFGQGSLRGIQQGYLESIQARRELFREMGPMMPNAIDESARQAASNLSQLSSAAATLRVEFDALAGVLSRILGGRGVPALPQNPLPA